MKNIIILISLLVGSSSFATLTKQLIIEPTDGKIYTHCEDPSHTYFTFGSGNTWGWIGGIHEDVCIELKESSKNELFRVKEIKMTPGGTVIEIKYQLDKDGVTYLLINSKA